MYKYIYGYQLNYFIFDYMNAVYFVNISRKTMCRHPLVKLHNTILNSFY
jgi:hypothetical protein